jgi:hypothetical protein
VEAGALLFPTGDRGHVHGGSLGGGVSRPLATDLRHLTTSGRGYPVAPGPWFYT